MDVHELLTIRETAEITGIGAHTLRYYERIGLLQPVRRNGGGHRRYRRDDLRWITMLTCLRRTGMPIRTMQQYAALQREGDPTGEKREALLEAHRQEVTARQREIAEHLEIIDHKIGMYQRLRAEWDGESDNALSPAGIATST